MDDYDQILNWLDYKFIPSGVTSKPSTLDQMETGMDVKMAKNPS